MRGPKKYALPAQNPVSVSYLLTGLNTLASSLTGFNVFGGTPAGAVVSVIAIARSDV